MGGGGIGDVRMVVVMGGGGGFGGGGWLIVCVSRSVVPWTWRSRRRGCVLVWGDFIINY